MPPPPEAELTPPVVVAVVPALECPSDTTPSECVVPGFVSSVGAVDFGLCSSWWFWKSSPDGGREWKLSFV